ncbi:CHAT domain-containing protein [Janthinobacterium sp. 64]|uniref:CHAT domain-containing protein n=1 Tax=Janthinobacterium sp. 64 TaxID=2035208 RepID=UPI000C2BF581|nr:CHAT domain-containing protein [Janthinobacterium sp. 64]
METTKNLTAPMTNGFDPRIAFPEIYLEIADLIIGAGFEEIIGRTASFLLLAAQDGEGKKLFRNVTIVLPPKLATDADAASIFLALNKGAKFIRGNEFDDQEILNLKSRIRIEHCRSLATEDAIELIKSEVKERHIVAIVDASKYRSTRANISPISGITATRAEEDMWCPHVAVLAEEVISVLIGNESYAILQVNELPPTRPVNEELLNAVSHCYPIYIQSGIVEEWKVVSEAERWIGLALTGKIEEVRAEIEKLKIDQHQRIHLLAQVYSRAGCFDQLLEQIDELIRIGLKGMESSQRIQLASMVMKAGGKSQATDLIREAIIGAKDEHWIEQALEVALELQDDVLIAEADQQLASVLPNSVFLRETRDRRLILNCINTGTDQKLFPSIGWAPQHQIIFEWLSVNADSYDELFLKIKGEDPSWEELARVCSALHAHKQGNDFLAIELAQSVIQSPQYDRQAAQVLLQAVQKLMLKQSIAPSDSDFYRAPLATVVDYLSKAPHDTSVRSRLARLFSIEACGLIGLPIISALTLAKANSELGRLQNRISEEKKETSQQLIFQKETSSSNSAGLDKEFTDFFRNALQWMSEKGAAEYGVTRLPIGLVPSNVDATVRRLINILGIMAAKHGAELDIETMEKVVAVICSITHYADETKNEDLSALRILADRLADSSQYQDARNIAEQLLRLCRNDTVRCRLVWNAYGDIYHRCNNHVEALLGIACAMASSVDVDGEVLWQEVYALVRVLRDLHFFELAKEYLPLLARLLEQLGVDPHTDIRLSSLDISIRLMDTDSKDSEGIARLVADASKNCAALLGRRDNLLPAALLLAQAIGRSHSAAVPVDEKHNQVFKETVAKLDESAANFVSTFSSFTPDVKSTLALFNDVQKAMYAADTPSDYAKVTIVARRLLGRRRNGLSTDPKIVFLATELLAEQAIEMPAGIPHKTLSAEWPTQFCSSLAKENISIISAALSDDGEILLGEVDSHGERLIPQPIHANSFRQRLSNWLQKHPRRYGDANVNALEIERSIEPLELKIPAPTRLLIVAEPALQQITWNLALVQSADGFPYFLGTSTAIGTVPSLSWLSAIRSAPRTASEKYVAWISADDLAGEISPLNIAFDNLQETFKKYQFEIDSSGTIPAAASNAAIAVVVAHGGLAYDQKFIHSIRDEGKLILAPSAFARSFAGTEVVILFVCSGGRMDKHPHENTTVGMPKLLLSSGVRAVVASPWPLDSLMTFRWLDPFMSSWESGTTIIDAVKTANDCVAFKMDRNPQHCLAMTVHGDALLRKSATATTLEQGL